MEPLWNDRPAHRASLLRSGAFVLQNDPLPAAFARRHASLPDFRVIIELQLPVRQTAENIFAILRNRRAGTFQRPRSRPAVRFRRRGSERGPRWIRRAGWWRGTRWNRRRWRVGWFRAK